MNGIFSLFLVVSVISGLTILALQIFLTVIKSKNTNSSENTNKESGIVDKGKYKILSNILKRKGKNIDLTSLKQIIS